MKVSAKNSNLMVWAVVGVALIYAGTTFGLIPSNWLPAGAGGGDSIIVNTESNQAGISVSCWDISETATTGGYQADVQIFNGESKVADDDTSGGQKTYDVNQGFVSGQTLTVKCYNNSDSGAYEESKTVTLSKGMNSVSLPMMIVGNPSVSFYNNAGSATLDLVANERDTLKFDTTTSSTKTYYFNPVFGYKTSTGSIMDEITEITMSNGVTVSCDPYALSGYSKCIQIQGVVSGLNPISGGLAGFTCGASDCAGDISYKVVDGVPASAVGTASVDQSDAYDTTGTTGTITIT